MSFAEGCSCGCGGWDGCSPREARTTADLDALRVTVQADTDRLPPLQRAVLIDAISAALTLADEPIPVSLGSSRDLRSLVLSSNPASDAHRAHELTTAKERLHVEIPPP